VQQAGNIVGTAAQQTEGIGRRAAHRAGGTAIPQARGIESTYVYCIQQALGHLFYPILFYFTLHILQTYSGLIFSSHRRGHS
jgi:hypothetical protein